MEAFKAVLLLNLVLPPLAHCLNGAEREELCRGRCTWINDMKDRQQMLTMHLDYGEPGHAYCYEGFLPYTVPGLTHVWYHVQIRIHAKPVEGAVVAVGNSSKVVLRNDADFSNGITNLNITDVLYLSPFNVTCLGVRHSELVHHRVGYKMEAAEVLMYRYPVSLGIGLLLFFSASYLSRNVLLYYSTGVTLGIVASILILLYVFSKFVPKKNLIGLGVLFSGYTIAASFLYWVANYASEAIFNNWRYVLGYVVVAGLTSFAVLYRLGPVQNPRTLDLIQWSIQLVALVLVFLSCYQIIELAVAMVMVTLVSYCLPPRCNPLLWILYLIWCFLLPVRECCHCLSFLNPLSYFWRPPVRRLLTIEEYDHQGRVETAKALRELRTYCKKQEDMWSTISELKSPKRFTEFLSGKDHVTMEERVDHDWSFVVTDSESDTVDYSDDEGNSPPASHRSSFNSSSQSSFQYSSTDESPTHSRSYSHAHRTPHRPTSYPTSASTGRVRRY